MQSRFLYRSRVHSPAYLTWTPKRPSCFTDRYRKYKITMSLSKIPGAHNSGYGLLKIHVLVCTLSASTTHRLPYLVTPSPFIIQWGALEVVVRTVLPIELSSACCCVPPSGSSCLVEGGGVVSPVRGSSPFFTTVACWSVIASTSYHTISVVAWYRDKMT